MSFNKDGFTKINEEAFVYKGFIDKDGDKLFDEMVEQFQEIGFANLNIEEIVKEKVFKNI